MKKDIDLLEAIQYGFNIGMIQHYDEILSFAEWLAPRHPHNIAEIGTHQGGTAAVLAQIASGQFISIDLPDGPFGGMDQKSCEERNIRLKKYFPNFIGILEDSHKQLTAELLRGLLLRDEKLDLLFIDGDHSYKGVKKDYEMYKEFVTPGGAIAFHDIEDNEFHKTAGCEVPKLWQELKGEKVEFNIHGPWGGIGVLIV
jgi:predicted O-methyltransferase YrrM